MKIARITYLFALCPALVVGMTSCGSSSDKLPGQALSYAEAYEYSKKVAPEYNMRTSLSKSVDVNLAIDAFTIDGKVTIPGSEPTNLRFTMPKQDDFLLNLKNEMGVEGALEVRERLARDFSANANAGIKKPGKFGGNFLYNAIFNPFFTTYTLSYLHTLISTFDDLNIISEDYSLKGETFYVRYSIGDLAAFSEAVEEYELRAITEVFTVFRGTDGNVALTMGFDKFGYLSNFNLKAKSNDLVLIADSTVPDIETFRGYADVDFKANIKQNFYADADYHMYTTSDNSNAELKTRRATLNEYKAMGFTTRRLDASFIDDVLNYHDVILPGYGVDFVVEHQGKTSTLNNITVDINGIKYKASDLIESDVVNFSYNWKSNNAYGYQTDLIDEEYGETSGRILVDGSDPDTTSRLLNKSYYPTNGDYTLDILNSKPNRAFSLFEEVMSLETANGHKHSSVTYRCDSSNPQFGNSIAKNYMNPSFLPPYYPDGKSGIQVVFDTYNLPFRQDFYTELNALPYGYAHYNFMQGDGITYGSEGKGTKTAFATIDGASHGILDVIANIAKDGTYTSPVIKPAEGFIFNSSVINKPEALMEALRQMGFFKLAESYRGELDVDALIKEITLNPVPADSWGKETFEGFTFKVSKKIMDEAVAFSKDGEKNQTHEGLFRLTDFASDYIPNIENRVFIKAKYDPMSSFYLDYGMISENNDSCIYNPVTGLENGAIKFEVSETKDSVTFKDVVIAADDGYAFPSNDGSAADVLGKMIAGKYRWTSQSNTYVNFDELDEIVQRLGKIAKLNDEKTKLIISEENIASEDEKSAFEKELYKLFTSLNEKLQKSGEVPTNHFKCLFSSIVEETKSYKTVNAIESSSSYLNVVPGKDFTYIQVLPEYCDLIDKDLDFIFGF